MSTLIAASPVAAPVPGPVTSLATLDVGWCLLAAGVLLALAALTVGDPRTRFARGRRIRRAERPSLGRRLVASALALACGIVLVGGTGLWWVRRDLIGNIDTVALDRPAAGPAEGDVRERYPHGRNLLLLGSDTREGLGAEYGTTARIRGARSDTAILLHIGGSGRWISGVSIPRDTVMDLPLTRSACGPQPAERRARFNVAFEVGGPACSVAAAERLTGLGVDNVLVVDFAGFTEIVDALGGLSVCLRRPVHDTDALLDLPAGSREIDGRQTLSLMRARHNLGDGSDIGRTARQQYLITLIAGQVRSAGLLKSPAKLYRVATAATRSLTTDQALGGVEPLLDLATQISGVKESRIHLSTLAWLPDPANPGATVVIDETRARPVLRAMDEDLEPGARRRRPATTTTTPGQPGGTTERPASTRTPATRTTSTTDPSVRDLFCGS